MRQKVMVPTNGSSMILNASRASGSLSSALRIISYAVFCLKKKDHHDGDALDIGLPARSHATVEDDRPRDVLLTFLVDIPHQLLARGDVGLLGLLIEQLFDLLVAVVGRVPVRIAGIVLVERLVGIVDGVAS